MMMMMMMIWHQCKTDRRPILHFGTFQMTTSAVPAKHGGNNGRDVYTRLATI